MASSSRVAFTKRKQNTPPIGVLKSPLAIKNPFLNQANHGYKNKFATFILIGQKTACLEKKVCVSNLCYLPKCIYLPVAPH